MRTSSVLIKENFQARSKKDGDIYEDCIAYHLCSLGHELKEKDPRRKLKELGIETDFYYEEGNTKCYVECKGGRKARPGAERTDNVKKAIGNGALLKFKYPEAHYILYFSAPPKSGLASYFMIKTALEAGFVDEVYYIGYENENKI